MVQTGPEGRAEAWAGNDAVVSGRCRIKFPYGRQGRCRVILGARDGRSLSEGQYCMVGEETGAVCIYDGTSTLSTSDQPQRS